jgi:hypothetical protein
MAKPHRDLPWHPANHDWSLNKRSTKMIMKRDMTAGMIIIVALTCAVGADTNTIATAPTNRIDTVIIPSLEIRDTPPAQVLEVLVSAAMRPIPEPSKDWSIGMISPPPIQDPRPPILDAEHPAWTNMPRLTLEMTTVSLRQALDRVTQELGLTYEVTGSNIVVRTEDGEELNRDESVEPAGERTAHPRRARRPLTRNVVPEETERIR